METCLFAAISLSILPYFEMPQAEMSSRFPNFDAYFETVQSKKLPSSLRASSTTAFAQILVPPFPEVPGGKVITHYVLLFVLSRLSFISH